jgi:hypothetical protein
VSSDATTVRYVFRDYLRVCRISELRQYAVLLDNDKIEVKVTNGGVPLASTVASDYLRTQASKLANRAGARCVDTESNRVTSLDGNCDLRQSRYDNMT